MEHILTGCSMTEDAVELALTAVEGIKGCKAATTIDGRLTAAFRKIESGDNDDSEKKVHKVLGKLHDDISKILKNQTKKATLTLMHSDTTPGTA